MNLTDKERKLILLALDRAASPGETDNAAVALVRSFKARFRDGYKVLDELESKGFSPTARSRTNYVVDYGETVLPFGKYRGQELRDVPPDYLLWVLRNFERLNDSLREAITRFLREEDFR
jgi:hypothetical protein